MEHRDEYNINYEYICRYVRRTIPRQEALSALERYAAAHDVPIAQPETIGLICVLLRAMGAKRVLEVGAAIGYSAIAMAHTGAEVTTIEKDPEMLRCLHANLKTHGLTERVRALEGDAGALLPALDGMYDLVFLDAAKGQYNEFLPHCHRLLRPGGLLFSDNVLYKGMVATDELVLRRKITIVKRLRAYLDGLCASPLWETVILPVGDGAALSYKRREGEQS